MRILWDNILDRGQVIEEDAPFTAPLNNEHLMHQWISNIHTAEIIVQCEEEEKVNTLLIDNHTLQNTDVELSMGYWDEENEEYVWEETISLDVVSQPKDKAFVHFFEEDLSSTAYKVKLEDLDENPLKIGKLFLGTYLQLPGVNPDIELPRVSNSSRSISISGQVFGSRGYKFYNPRLNIPLVDNEERQEFIRMFEYVDITKPIYLILWANNLDKQPPIHCVMEEPSFSFRMDEKGKYWQTEVGFLEVR